MEPATRWFRRWLDNRLPYDAREAPPTTQRAWVDYQRTLLRYRPRPYPGKLSLVLSEQYAAGNVGPSWELLVRDGVEVHRTHGDHDSYIRAHAKTTAGILDACLERARNEADLTP